jgi:hypothetical protein
MLAREVIPLKKKKNSEILINLLKTNQRKLRKYFLIRATFFLKPILFLLHFEIHKKTFYKNL